MPGYLLHQGAQVLCAHGGQAMPSSPFPRVKLSGQAVTVQPFPYQVGGCANPANPPGPCVLAMFATGALRVKAGGMPVLLQDSMAVCAPTGTPLTIVMTQVRVKGM